MVPNLLFSLRLWCFRKSSNVTYSYLLARFCLNGFFRGNQGHNHYDVNTISDDLDGGLPSERASGAAETSGNVAGNEASRKPHKSMVRQNSRTASSLNLVVTNGDHVVATRHRTCAEVPPSLYLSVGHEYMNSGNMVIGGSHDFKGIGALLIASEPLSQQYAHQWMLLEPGEMVSASFIKHHEGESQPANVDQDDDPEVETDIILMRKCLSTACQKRKGRMHGRGVWAKNDYWVTTSIIVLATLFLIMTCIISFYRSQFVKLCIVRVILWLRRKSRAHSL